jgi:hypothetical protein
MTAMTDFQASSSDHTDALAAITEQAKHLEGLHRLALPDNEDTAVRVIVRYFADRGLVNTTTIKGDNGNVNPDPNVADALRKHGR